MYRDLDSHCGNESLNPNVISKVLEGLFRTHIRLSVIQRDAQQ